MLIILRDPATPRDELPRHHSVCREGQAEPSSGFEFLLPDTRILHADRGNSKMQ
jgi:hypothetical protein